MLCFLGVQPVTVFTLQFTLLTKYKSCAKYKKCIFEMCPSNIYIANMHRVTRQYQFIALFWSKLNRGVIKCKLHMYNRKFENVTYTNMMKIPIFRYRYIFIITIMLKINVVVWRVISATDGSGYKFVVCFNIACTNIRAIVDLFINSWPWKMVDYLCGQLSNHKMVSVENRVVYRWSAIIFVKHSIKLY